MLNNNLGGAYRHRVKGDKAENQQIAIAFLNKALLVYTKDRFPRQWAFYLVGNNLFLKR